MSITETKNTVHTSRWGYHPCTKEECQKLKKIHKLLLRAYRDIRKWIRWTNKEPQNQKGEEPKHPSFLVESGYHSTPKRTWFGYGFAKHKNKNLYLHVLEQYQKARTPLQNSIDIVPLDLPNNEIVKMLESFYSEN